MKRNKGSKAVLTGLTALFMAAFAFPAMHAWASSSIDTVSIRVDRNDDEDFQVGSYLDDSLVDVKTPDSGSDNADYRVAEYSFNNNSGAYITTDSVPQLQIVLETSDDKTFGLTKASQVKLTGDTKPEYVTASVREDDTQLVITVDLTSLTGKAGAVESADWDVNRTGKIDVISYGGNGHQIQLYRDGKKTGGGIIDIGQSGARNGAFTIDVSKYIRVPGKYTFDIRQFNEETHARGTWYSCTNTYTVTDEVAAANRAKYGYISDDGYGWQKDSVGWWYRMPGGSYPANRWVMDNEHWFWFDERGYMVTGWRLIGGKWYYFNPSGEMLADTTTPDGYTVGADGAYIA
jgi:glucan-binding YG repeat protein